MSIKYFGKDDLKADFMGGKPTICQFNAKEE